MPPWGRWACARAGFTAPPCNNISRPHLVQLARCTGVVIQDLNFVNRCGWGPPMHNLHLHAHTPSTRPAQQLSLSPPPPVSPLMSTAFPRPRLPRPLLVGAPSSSWTLNPTFVTSLLITNNTITNPSDSHNTDGIDTDCVQV